MNNKGIAVLGAVAIGAIITLFVLYTSGHPIQKKQVAEPVKVVETVVQPEVK